MPTWYQTDFADPYSSGTIASHGCGLTCAAMAFSYWSGTEVDPSELADTVGSSCLTGDVNDMRKFRDWGASRYGLAGSDIYYGIDAAIDDARAGKTAWCSVSGWFGSNWYGGHIVLLYQEGERLMVRDPAWEPNTRQWSEKELRSQTSWAYFYSVWKKGAS